MSSNKLQQLNHLSLIRIDGDDATAFLQGQLTNDVSLSNQQWQFNGYCSPKGRLLALLQLWQYDDVYYAVLDKSLCEATLKRLRMYVMRSKVIITELDDMFFYAAQDWADINAVFSVPQTPEDKQVVMLGSAISIRFGHQFLLMSPELNHDQVTVDNNPQWHTNNILSGLPRVTAKTVEMFIPQMLNLDVIDGINFKKGCYTGQEIIARMHYLGKLKQRMFVAKINGELPELGATIYADNACEKSVGNIVDSSNGNALAVLRLNALENSNRFYLDQQSSLEVNKVQPYELPSTKENLN